MTTFPEVPVIFKHTITCPAHPLYAKTSLEGNCTGCRAVAYDSLLRRQTEMIEGRLAALQNEARDWQGDYRRSEIECRKMRLMAHATYDAIRILQSTFWRRVPTIKRLLASLEETVQESLDRGWEEPKIRKGAAT